MDKDKKRHLRFWRLVFHPVRILMRLKFGFRPDPVPKLPEGGCLHMKLDWLLPRGFTVHCSSVISTLTADCGFAAPDSALARYAQPELSDHNVVRASLALPQKEE